MLDEKESHLVELRAYSWRGSTRYCVVWHVLKVGVCHMRGAVGKESREGQDRLPRGKSFAGSYEGWEGGERAKSRRNNKACKGWEMQEGEAGLTTCESLCPESMSFKRAGQR